MRAALIAAAIAAGFGLAAGFVVAGPAGLIVAGTGLAAVAMLAVRATLGPGETRRAAVRDQGAGSGGVADPFRAYRKIAADLGWAGVSRRHYDHAVRPLVARLAAAALADRHRIDMAREPGRARRLAGEDLWPLIDPARPASTDDRAPGVDRATLIRIVDRLEDL
jgi:hypothetical protein